MFRSVSIYLSSFAACQVLPKQYGGQADMVPAAEAVAARLAGRLQRRSSRRRSLAREAPAAESRLAAAKGAIGCAGLQGHGSGRRWSWERRGCNHVVHAADVSLATMKGAIGYVPHNVAGRLFVSAAL
jgi:hypothetical protein